MIYLGEKKVGSIYLGDKKLSKIYLGEKLVWEGYPEGHIIGTSMYQGTSFSANSFKERGKTYATDLRCNADANKKIDFDVSQYEVGYSQFFYGMTYIVSIDSFKVVEYTPNISCEIYDCRDLERANINEFRIVATHMNGQIDNMLKTISIQSFLCECPNLKYIKAGGFEWDKVSRIEDAFRDLPALIELDLSGADFDGVDIDQNCFAYDFGTVGTVVKVIGCSATTQNKILNTLKTNHNGQRWVLKDGVITRTM